jgi:hypothetical protein
MSPDPDEFNAEEWLKQPREGVAGAKTGAEQKKGNGPDAAASGWGMPFMDVMRLRRRPPPPLPLKVFGDAWSDWIVGAAKAAACPPDYVAAPLLASVSTLIGHARWPEIVGWREPPHLWCVSSATRATVRRPAPAL